MEMGKGFKRLRGREVRIREGRGKERCPPRWSSGGCVLTCITCSALYVQYACTVISTLGFHRILPYTCTVHTLSVSGLPFCTVRICSFEGTPPGGGRGIVAGWTWSAWHRCPRNATGGAAGRVGWAALAVQLVVCTHVALRAHPPPHSQLSQCSMRWCAGVCTRRPWW